MGQGSKQSENPEQTATPNSYRLVFVLVSLLLAAGLWGARIWFSNQYRDGEQAASVDSTGTLTAAPTGSGTSTSKEAGRSSFGDLIDPKLLRLARQMHPRSFSLNPEKIVLWWDKIPDEVKARSVKTGDPETSNIRPQDYVGPESCIECHKSNYDDWSNHAHRWMNTIASDETVKGDFSGDAVIDYMGGRGTFFREGDQYRMRLERDGLERLYRITQTIGSRFFQYYAGKQLVGPESTDDWTYVDDHVLPFGYWLDEKQWVPIVHVSSKRDTDSELPDGQRFDPFSDPDVNLYVGCNTCHTTFALGDRLVRNIELMSREPPFPLHLSAARFLGQTRPDLVDPTLHPSDFADQELQNVHYDMFDFEAPKHAITLGVSCEACHLGSRAHAEGKLERPSFFPRDPLLYAETDELELEMGRNHRNVNWACGRCHTGERPYLAAGMSTWNSTEYSDAMRGSCYSELSCIDCHNPHKTIGPEWSLTPAQNDALCLKCHSSFESPEARVAHTHHPVGSDGARCMNCHMPRLNEGLQDVVRTHMIFSPTNAAMIEANHPNACNICHTDETIDWTQEHLSKWYGATYDESKIAEAYPHRDGSAAFGWLKSENEAVRLLAADALIRDKNKSALPELLDALDDPYLLNRQFARRSLDRWLGISLRDYGYRFYMLPDERRESLSRIRADLLSN